MHLVSQFLDHLQRALFPKLDEEIGPLSPQEKRLVRILEFARVEEFVPQVVGRWAGRPEKDRKALARAFLAKHVLEVPTTRLLRDQVLSSHSLRRICGWERRCEVPSEATFSRAFSEFTRINLCHLAHADLIETFQKPRLVGHISRDSTAIRVREKAKPKSRPAPPQRSRGETKPPTRLQRQLAEMDHGEMIAELPQQCDWGCKRNSAGKTEHWKGYKLHVDWADGEIAISCMLTSASVHDSQAAIPLAITTAQRVTSLYDVMDAAYDAKEIRQHSRRLGHVPIIEINRRNKTTPPLAADPAKARRYDERTTAERGNSRLLDSFGARSIRVRGASKVMTHLMFGILALTAEQLLRLSG